MTAKRGTGRTTRLLEDAVRLAKQGRAVYVIAANRSHAKWMERMLPQATALGVKFETPETMSTFDWQEWRSPGAHPNCVFLADHFTIESRFGRLLEMWTRYDDPAPSPQDGER